MTYDLLVIGDEEEGIERAISVARKGRRVVVIRSSSETISLDQIRRGVEDVVKSSVVTMQRLRDIVTRRIRLHTVAACTEMERWGIELLTGQLHFVSDSVVEISEGGLSRMICAEEILIACGTKSRQPDSFRCGGHRVLVPESILDLDEIPRSSIVVGAGRIGLTTAIVMGRLGVDVTVVDENGSLVDICRDLDGSLDEIPSLPIAFRLNDEVIGTTLHPDSQVAARLASGRVLAADAIIICVGRVGKTETLNLERAGVGLDERGRLWCDHHGQTWAKRISVVGDVAGVPRHRSSTISGRLFSTFSGPFAQTTSFDGRRNSLS